jgi:uncharacterized protein involved in response to NO
MLRFCALARSIARVLNSVETRMVIVSGLLLMVAPLLYCPKYFSTIRGMVTVQKAYKFRIYPDAEQRKQLAVE